jgi:putative pyruvate formate lyase activating enzyme
MEVCTQCRRNCKIDRSHGNVGFCGVPGELLVARAALHPWEEPFLSGTRGSGTIFFCGCNLQCVFCQNREISRGKTGKTITPDALADVMLRLRDAGAHNINLVTPSHYALQLIPVLERIKPTLGIPVVYNCGGYESVETLRKLEGLVDIYLPDFKYFDGELAQKYSGADDYCEIATSALAEMLRQCPSCNFDGEGMLLRGVAVRHLVLPGARSDSIKLLRFLAERFGSKAFLLSLMSQYTPDFAVDSPYPVLLRRVTTFEYESVLKEAEALGFEGCIQERSSASASYTPDFYEKSFL